MDTGKILPFMVYSLNGLLATLISNADNTAGRHAAGGYKCVWWNWRATRILGGIKGTSRATGRGGTVGADDAQGTFHGGSTHTIGTNRPRIRLASGEGGSYTTVIHDTGKGVVSRTSVNGSGL
jgi:hypothetical protein